MATGEHHEKKTWWLWDAEFDGSARHRIVVEVNTVITCDGFRVDTPVGYFSEYEGHGALATDEMMIENEEFAKQRAAGTIRPLSPEFDLQGEHRQDSSVSVGESPRK